MPTSHHEVLVAGPLAAVKGFLAGYLVARGLEPGHVIVGEEHNIDCESMIEQLKELVHIREHVSHLVVPDDIFGELTDAIGKVVSVAGIKVTAARPVRSAYFTFRYNAYTREQFDQLHAIIANLPESVRVSDDYQPTATEDPTAAGVEGYTPAHDFEASGSGSVTGSVADILDLHAKATANELFVVSGIKLHHDDD
jgi:hypothetical protein